MNTNLPEDLLRRLEAVVRMVHDLSIREKNLGESMDPVEKRAVELGAVQVSQAIRRAFIRLTDAGVILARLHLDLSVPPTAFRTGEDIIRQRFEAEKEMEKILETRDKAALREDEHR